MRCYYMMWNNRTWHDMMWYDKRRYDMIREDMIREDIIGEDMILYDMMDQSTIWYDVICIILPFERYTTDIYHLSMK